MTSLADYFRDIEAEEDAKSRQRAIQDGKPSFKAGDSIASPNKSPKTMNAPTEFVASKNRRKFHRRDCEWAEYILYSQNLVTFSSPQEAIQAGYKPCRTCLGPSGTEKKSS